MVECSNENSRDGGSAKNHANDAAVSLSEGASCEIAYRVAASDSPRSLRLEAMDDFPDVLSTAKMIGLMEVAAARLLRPELKSDELSVGVSVQVDHLAATPLYADVRIRATYLGREGRLYLFDVELTDRGGVAGKGRHARAIVQSRRLIEGAQRRMGGV